MTSKRKSSGQSGPFDFNKHEDPKAFDHVTPHGGRGASHHSTECNRLFDKYKEALKAYEQKWPKHCRDCGGAGAFYFPGNREQPPDVDVCSKCVEIGMCPRCGANSLKTGEEERCSACDFDLIKPQEVKPEYECICF